MHLPSLRPLGGHLGSAPGVSWSAELCERLCEVSLQGWGDAGHEFVVGQREKRVHLEDVAGDDEPEWLRGGESRAELGVVYAEIVGECADEGHALPAPVATGSLTGSRARLFGNGRGTRVRDGLELGCGGLGIALADGRDHPERPAGADPRLLALRTCQIALCPSLLELGA